MGLSSVVTTALVCILLTQKYSTAQDLIYDSPGDPGFFQAQEQVEFRAAWPDSSMPLRLKVNGARNAALFISPVPHLIAPHYAIFLNAHLGCSWTPSHGLARDYSCRDVVSAFENPILQEGTDVAFTISYTGNLLTVTMDGATSPLLSYQDTETICTCCYIGFYSWFQEDVTWTFPDTLPQAIDLIGKTTMQSTISGSDGSTKAIDGNLDIDVDDGDSCAITMAEAQTGDVGPYWRVDLGDEYIIEQVVLYDAFDCTDCCPVGWVSFDKHCYLVVDTVTAPGNYPDAVDDCTAKINALDSVYGSAPQTGSLTSILSYQEKNFLRGYASTTPFWIGLKEGGTTEGVFEWEEDGADFDYTNWDTLNPDNDLTAGMYCVQAEADGRWNDVDCATTVTNNHICKIRQKRVLEGIEIRVGSCDFGGTTDYDGETLPFVANTECGDGIDQGQAGALLGAAPEKCISKPYGRYIYIHLPEGGPVDPQQLILCELKVFGQVASYGSLLPVVFFPEAEINIPEDIPNQVLQVTVSTGLAASTTVPPTCYSFGLTTVDGTAEAGNTKDYTAVAQTFHFIPGVTTQQQTYDLMIPIHDDIISEYIETFTIEIVDVLGDNEGLSNTTATVNIQDDDGCFTFVRSTYMVSEPSSQPLIHKWINITVAFLPLEGVLPPYVTGSVRFDTIPIDTDSIVDFELYNNHRVEFGPGVRSINIPVGITDDSVTELDETFRVTLSEPSDLFKLGNITEAIVTIVESDHHCSLSQAIYDVLESHGTVEIMVTCSEIVRAGASVDIVTESETAEARVDYNVRKNRVEFDGTSLSGSFLIDIVDDVMRENSENFKVYLVNGNGIGTDGDNSIREAEVTIADNDASYTVSLPTNRVSEDDDDRLVYAVVKRNGYNQRTGSVWIRTKLEDTDNANPADGNDFIAVNERVDFSVGESEEPVAIRIIDDSIPEASVESFLVELYNPVNGVLGDPISGEVFIFDNDESSDQQYYFDRSEYDVLESEEDLSVTVSRTDARAAGSVTVSTGSYSNDARPGIDYVEQHVELDFAAGETSKPVTIQIIGDDNIVEGPKKFHVDLFFPVDGKLGTPRTATINIIDDDVTVTFVEAKYGAFEDAGILEVPVRRTSYMGTVSIGISSDDGQATSGEDYIIPETITFAEGDDTAYVPVTIVNDFDDESDAESLVLELNPGSRGTVVGLSRTTVTIFDNDEDEESDDDGNKLDTSTIALIGLGVGFGLFALFALIGCACVCARTVMTPRAPPVANPAPYPYPYRGEGLAGPPPYRTRPGPYLT